MKKFLVLVIALGGLFYYKPALFHFSGKSGAFDSKGNAQTLLFTQNGCGASCDSAVKELKERGLAFREVPLDSDENLKRYQELGGNGTIPLLAVGSQAVLGYDKGQYASALAQNFGDSALTRAEQIFYKRRVDRSRPPHRGGRGKAAGLYVWRHLVRLLQGIARADGKPQG